MLKKGRWFRAKTSRYCFILIQAFKVICICYKSITEENKIAYVLKYLALCGAE